MNPTARGYLVTGEYVQVTHYLPGRSLVTVGDEKSVVYHHRTATDEGWCECGATTACVHRAAVVAAQNERLYWRTPEMLAR